MYTVLYRCKQEVYILFSNIWEVGKEKKGDSINIFGVERFGWVHEVEGREI